MKTAGDSTRQIILYVGARPAKYNRSVPCDGLIQSF